MTFITRVRNDQGHPFVFMYWRTTHLKVWVLNKVRHTPRGFTVLETNKLFGLNGFADNFMKSLDSFNIRDKRLIKITTR